MIRCRAAQAAAEWPQVQEAVAKLCLAWWQAEAPGRDALVPQTLPYLLVRALTGAPRGAGARAVARVQPGCPPAAHWRGSRTERPEPGRKLASACTEAP